MGMGPVQTVQTEVDKNGQPALGAQLQALRSVAAAPHSGLLHDFGQLGELKNSRSDNDYIPKLAAALTGWTVIRVWEHEDPTQAADQIVEIVRRAITQGEGAR